MNGSNRSGDTRRGRSIFIAVVIATATAAVTAGVALNEHHPQAHAIPAAAAADTGRGGAAPAFDPSLPVAADVIERAPAEPA
jgi:hypothetical protein